MRLTSRFVSGLALVVALGAPALATAESEAWVWGWNVYGQGGDAPVHASAAGDAIAVDGGYGHCLVLRADGTLRAWGYGYWGPLGYGGFNSVGSPVDVVGLSGVVAIAAGNNNSHAIRSDGTLWAWGANDHGQLGLGSVYSRAGTPQQVLDPADPSGFLHGAVASDAGHWHSLVLKADGSVWSFGNNDQGRLGDGTNVRRTLPVRVVDPADASGYLTDIVAIAAGSHHSLAVKSDGTVWAWGNNWNGPLGDGTGSERWTPVQVLDGADPTGFLTGVVGVSGGESHSLAVKADGTVRAWGRNVYRNIGDGTNNTAWTATQVRNPGDPTGYLTGVVRVAAGGSFSLALTAEGSVWGWGSNTYGQLGNAAGGWGQYVGLPVSSALAQPAATIGAGSEHGLAVVSGAAADTTPPSLTAPADQTLECTDPDGQPVALGTPSVSDDTDPSPAVANDAPALFLLGATEVTWTATDASANVASAVQLVTVSDATPPTVAAGADLTVIAGEPVVLPIATASDVCDAAVDLSSDAPLAFPVGATTVTVTARDASGNEATDTLVVTVLSAAGATGALAGVVTALAAPAGTVTSLVAKLDSAAAALARGQTNAGVQKLLAFLNQVAAQRGKHLTADDADALTAYTQRILATL